jgi:hypothetical protein
MMSDFNIVDCPGHHFTDEMIDAAWHQAIESRGFPARIDILEELHIFRCEGCDGQRGVGPVRPSITGENYHVQNKCPDCNGHGWVIGEDQGGL